MLFAYMCACIKQQNQQTDTVSRVRGSVVNMSKSCCFAVVLAVICLSVILLSLEADAQPTADETLSCYSTPPSTELVDMFRTIASSQHQSAKEIKDVKALLTSNPLDCYAVQPSKQALVSALLCTSLHFLLVSR